MRLVTFLPPGSEVPRAGEVRDGRVFGYAQESITVIERLADPEAAPVEGASFSIEEATLLAPVPLPRAIFGIGLNYADHVRETGESTPERPLVFTKLPSSAAPPNGAVHCPRAVAQLDYEGELAVIMGPGRAVAGYAVADDLTARDLQGSEPQWTRAKGADGFCPFGPWITTAEEIEDPHTLSLRTWVNGELRQDSNTSNLVFTIPELIEFICETCTLETGDVILTGTPAGVGIGQDPAGLPAHRRHRAHRDRAPRGDRARRRLSARAARKRARQPLQPASPALVNTPTGSSGRAAAQWLSSTRSTRPYSSACAAVKKRSRSMSWRTCSLERPVCSA